MSDRPREPDGTVRDGRRLESDSMGQTWVPADRLWGADTERALAHFRIGDDKAPKELIEIVAMVKEASARANADLGGLDRKRADAIIEAAREIRNGKRDDDFPLSVWLSGSGTQINMNVNEVISNRAIEIMGGTVGAKNPVHPNDHVNMSQSTNDVIPTAMYIAAATGIRDRLVPTLRQLEGALYEKSREWSQITKIARTHFMDAVPITLGQEFSGYAAMVAENIERIEAPLPGLCRLAIGGTAVGTGITAERGFGEMVVRHLAEMTGLPLIVAPNRFAVQGAHDALVMASGVLKTLAVSLYKIANDIRLLGSGPRSGLHELIIPANEPGSSIMPGKVNPTQCEALTMVAVQVMGYDAAVAFAGAGGSLEMNVYKPLIAFNVLQSIRLLADGCRSFTEFLVSGLEPDTRQIDDFLKRSLMLVTALVPFIGYDKASEIAILADREGLTLRDAALKTGHVTPEEFDRIVDPYRMTHSEE
jgi:fumarate hydratase, class II